MAYGSISVDQINNTTGYSLGAGNASLIKNRVINGAMVISQSAAGATLNPPVSTAYATNFPVDRFFVAVSQTSKLTTAQTTATSLAAAAGFTKALNVTVTSAYSVGADEVFVLQQRIEGYNVADFQFGTSYAKTITLSFWVNCSVTGAFGGVVMGASGTRSYPFSYTVNQANTWEQKSITIPGCTTGTWLTTNGNGMLLGWSLGVGSNFTTTANTWANGEYYNSTGGQSLVATAGATWNITGVQLEVGSVATGYEYRQYGQELSLCQRYYQKVSSGMICCCESGTTQVLGTILFPTCMRSTPAVSTSAAMRVSDVAYSGFVQSSAAASIGTGNADSVRVRMPNFTGLTEARWYQQTNDSSAGILLFSAEL